MTFVELLFTGCAESADGQATPEISARRSSLCFALSSSCSMSLFLSSGDLREKLLFFCFCPPGPFHYTLGSPCSQGSEAKRNQHQLPLQACVLLLPSCFSFAAGEVSPPTLLGLPGSLHRSCVTTGCPLASPGPDLGSNKPTVSWLACVNPQVLV